MSKQIIESRLDRSLANQVRSPKLGRSFDAAVWARIEAESSASRVAAARPQKSSAARWLFASNVVGIAVTALLVLYFGVRMLTGVAVEVPMPSLSPEVTSATLRAASWAITIAALAFGVMLTPLGRWLRSEFRQFY